METLQKTRWLHYLKGTSFVSVIGFGFIALAIKGYSAPWTGFGETADTSIQVKTLWDWMSLLIIPLFLVGCTMLLNRSKRSTEQQRSEEQSTLQREIALDSQQEAA